MTYIPTKEELEELGFEIIFSTYSVKRLWDKLFSWKKIVYMGHRCYAEDTQNVDDDSDNSWELTYPQIELHPQSLEDIKILIRILTP